MATIYVTSQLGSWTAYSNGEYQLATFTNPYDYNVVVNSITGYFASGNGSYYNSHNGQSATGSGGNLRLYFRINQNSSYQSSTVTVTDTAGVATNSSGDRYPPASQVNQKLTLTFSNSPIISPGSTVYFYTYFTGDNVLCAQAESSGGTDLQINVTRPPISGSVTVTGQEKTILYGANGTLSCTYKTSGVPSGYDVDISYTRRSGTATVSGSSINNVRSQCTIRATVTLTHSNYSGSVTGYDDFTISCKLNTPTVTLESDTGGFTIGTEVSPTVAVGTNPSGCSRGYQVSIDNGTWTTTSVPYFLDEGSRLKFRARLSKEDYVTSNYSSASANVDIYYEPRLMSDNGFTYNFKYIKSGTTEEVELPLIDNNEVVVPTSTLVVNWGSFLPSKNLGRFNRYTTLLVEDTATEEELYNSGVLENNPSAGNHKHTFEVNPLWAGKTCVIKLKCMCSWPDSSSGSLYGPASTAIFTSNNFFIGGSPDAPSIKYPSTTSFYSSNNRLRLIFSVTNPDYLSFEQITDVAVEISRQGYQTKTYTYKNNRRMFWSTNSVESTDPINNGAVLDFTVPEEYILDTGTTFRVNCSNQYLTSEWTGYYTVTMLPLSMMTNGRKLLKSDLMDVWNSPVKVLLGYSNYSSTASNSVNRLPEQTVQEDYKVQNEPYITDLGVISILRSLYSEVSKDSLPPEEFRLNLDNIDITTDNDEIHVDAETEFIYSSDVGSFTPIGNYFNFIVYIMTNML